MSANQNHIDLPRDYGLVRIPPAFQPEPFWTCACPTVGGCVRRSKEGVCTPQAVLRRRIAARTLLAGTTDRHPLEIVALVQDALRASDRPLGIGSPGASSPSWRACPVHRIRRADHATSRAGVRVAGGAIYWNSERRRARAEAHVLFALGDARRRSPGDSGTCGSSGPSHDAAIHAPEPGRRGRRDSSFRPTPGSASRWRHRGDGNRCC
jgi:hypothetical protein